MADKKKKQTKKAAPKSAEDKLTSSNKTVLVIYIIAYVVLCFLSMHIGHALTTNTMESTIGITHKMTIFDVINVMTANFATNPFNFLPFTIQHLKAWFIMTLFYGGFCLFRYIQYLRFKQTMPGESHGTSGWNTDYEGFARQYSASITETCHNPSILEKLQKEDEDAITKETPEIDMNLIFTAKNKLSFDNKKTNRNSNTIIMGGSGTGKSFSYIEPNIAQSNSSFVITDPSGEIYMNMYKFLIDEGYVVKVLNLKQYELGNHYNPFDYIRRKEDGSCDQTSVMAMVASFLDNAGDSKEEAFWRDSANALFCAAAFLLIETRPYKDWTMANVSHLIRLAKKDESSSSSSTAFDTLMQKAKAKNPDSMAYSFYQTFKLASQKTAESILVSTDVKLSKFSIPEFNRLTTTDLDDIENNVNLNAIGDKKTALFIITQTGGGPMDFLASMLYNQLFDIVYNRCESYLPTKVHVYSHNGYPLETMFFTKEDAEKYIETVKGCTIKSEFIKDAITKKDTEVFYLETANGKPLIERTVKMNPDIDKFAKPKKLLFRSRAKAQRYLNDFRHTEIKSTGYRMPWAITCLLDEFNNIGEIPKFDQILATCRKYNLNLSIVLQNLAQLKGRYEKTWNTILGNCDNFLFLGSSEFETCKYVSDILGDRTIYVRSESRSSGESGKANFSISEQARKLLDPSELTRLDNSYCIYVMRGELPFKVKKNSFADHINFMRTGCGNKDMETSQEEMKELYRKKPKKKTRTHKSKLYQKQAAQKPKPVLSKDDILNEANAYTIQDAVENLTPTVNEKPTQNSVESINNVAKMNVTVSEHGEEEWAF